MSHQTQVERMTGAAGLLELAVDRPAQPRPGGGVAVIAHPHPLYGGTMHNKVVQTLARAHVQEGWTALRLNFRGVGQSGGVHDGGIGETDDLLALIDQWAPQGPLALAGFSFGAYVSARVVAAMASRRAPQTLVLVGTAASRFPVPALPEELHPRTLVMHGEQDDTVALSCVMDWARPQGLPVTVIAGAEHFFHGRLALLKALTIRHLRACAVL